MKQNDALIAAAREAQKLNEPIELTHVNQRPPMQFTLTIELGNDAMRTRSDIRKALQMAAMALSSGMSPQPKTGDSATFRDTNGNTVGKWEVTETPAAWDCPGCGRHYDAPFADVQAAYVATGECFEGCPGEPPGVVTAQAEPRNVMQRIALGLLLHASSSLKGLHPMTLPAVHIFNPDHNLFCQKCSDGELDGDHGLVMFVDQPDGVEFESPEIQHAYHLANPTYRLTRESDAAYAARMKADATAFGKESA
jgi:hypothetical protein